mgnify:CR=1 FL=1
MEANIKTLYKLSVFNKKTFFDTITDDVGVLSKSTLEKYLKKYLTKILMPLPISKSMV